MAKQKNQPTVPEFEDDEPSFRTEFPGEFVEPETVEHPMIVDTRQEALEAVPGDKNFDRLVHDDQGNVRAIFANEGIGEVTREDALNVLDEVRAAGVYTITERATDGADPVYDVYRRGVLIIAGALREDLTKLL